MYKILTDSLISRTSDGACIPCNEANSDYRDYLDWVALGNIPQPMDSPINQVPQVITMRQARLALLQVGLLSSITTAISQLPSPQREEAEIEWEYSQVVERNWSFVLSIGESLSLDLDDLFSLASTL